MYLILIEVKLQKSALMRNDGCHTYTDLTKPADGDHLSPANCKLISLPLDWREFRFFPTFGYR